MDENDQIVLAHTLHKAPDSRWAVTAVVEGAGGDVVLCLLERDGLLIGTLRPGPTSGLISFHPFDRSNEDALDHLAYRLMSGSGAAPDRARLGEWWEAAISHAAETLIEEYRCTAELERGA